MSGIVVIGLSLSSSWGNGHATTYRALLSALAVRGHEILFLECDRPWYAQARDLSDPDFSQLALYRDTSDLENWRARIEAADLVILGSYVVNGIAVAAMIRPWAKRLVFYDIDTPVTLAAIERGDCAYLKAAAIPSFDAYLSFTGGPTLTLLEQKFGARAAHALYCAVDPARYRPGGDGVERQWHLGYLGTYSPDRQPTLERFLLEPARAAPELRCVVAGPQYPDNIAWPANVERIEHLPPREHAAFYNAQHWTLNVTRQDMIEAGWSPSVRLFEAAACGTAIISDWWRGLDDFFMPGRDIEIANNSGDVLRLLRSPHARAHDVGQAGRGRVLAEHTAAHRALQIEALMGPARVSCSANTAALTLMA